MRWLLLLALKGALLAQTYSSIIEEVDNSPLLQSAKELKMAASSAAEAARGKSMPSLDVSFGAAWLKERPTVTFRIPGYPPMDAPMGTKRNFNGSVRLAYPLFTGFAISAEIEKMGYESETARLKLLDLKRNLYLQATELAAACFAADKTLEAQIEAKKAMEDAYRKAKGLYDNGLLPPADLYNIEAKQYEVEAEIEETKTKRAQILNRLGYLINAKVESVDLPLYLFSLNMEKEALIEEALESREDIKVLKTVLKSGDTVIKLAESRLYPSVTLAAELKRRGDTPKLNGDGFTNPDQSYIGASLSWNLFNGFSDKKMIESARYRRLASAAMLNDYKMRVKTELENAFLDLSALYSRLKSAKMELKARGAYCELTKGRFENQLADADELSRSIAELFASKAKVAVLQSRIFKQKASILLMAGIDPFKRVVE
ncbi:cobalt-zinc-cadmium resistance protein CzcA [Hydrogenimonas sp.]|nr:cobalt-zinc-cadmium resistance protein CzcA [Hydrogenimonas sp.]